MERDNQYYRNSNRNREGNADRKLSNYESRYESHGNYYGMPDAGREYENVRTTRGAAFGNFSEGPMQRSSSNYNKYDRNSGQQGNRSYGDQNQNYGSSYGHQNSGNQTNRDSHYHYGDPNPYMGGYEQTRGTGWERDSSGAYRGSSSYDEGRYSRQNNSYESGGRGRRYSDFGRDEQRSYNPVGIDAYSDRSDYGRSSEDNNYRGQGHREKFYDGDARRDDYKHGEIRSIGGNNYAENENRYSSNSRDRRHASGPDYNASSAASDYSRSGRRTH